MSSLAQASWHTTEQGRSIGQLASLGRCGTPGGWRGSGEGEGQ